MDVIEYMNKLGVQAREAGREMSRADSGKKNVAL
jgi:glutamate-5-semialdehyde dehydrogenase